MNKNTIIEAKNLCKSFSNGNIVNHVLKNIKLEIYEGDFTVIMGSSGSGKSTLLYSLSTMDQPSSGSIVLCGQHTETLDEKQIARLRSNEISYVFQSMHLLNDLTVFENISYPGYLAQEKKKMNEITENLLKEVGLYGEKEKYPQELSGGQQQRVAIARALASSPKVLFADEPTGALNSASGKQVLDLLTGLHQRGQSIVMVTHDIKACVRGNRLLYLTDGHIGGKLNMGEYTAENQSDREAEVFHFLENHNW